MNVYALVHSRILAALQALQADGTLAQGLDFANVEVEPPRDAGHGDLATNAALVLAKRRTNPRDIADSRREARCTTDVAEVEVAGPGFINLTLGDASWHDDSPTFSPRARATAHRSWRGDQVNIEYVSANPTGPMHVGHCPGAVVGDVLGNLLEVRLRRHPRVLHQRCRRPGRRPRPVDPPSLSRGSGRDFGKMPEGLYPGDYLIPVGRALAKHGPALRDKAEVEWLPQVREAAIAAMMG